MGAVCVCVVCFCTAAFAFAVTRETVYYLFGVIKQRDGGDGRKVLTHSALTPDKCTWDNECKLCKGALQVNSTNSNTLPSCSVPSYCRTGVDHALSECTVVCGVWAPGKLPSD